MGSSSAAGGVRTVPGLSGSSLLSAARVAAGGGEMVGMVAGLRAKCHLGCSPTPGGFGAGRMQPAAVAMLTVNNASLDLTVLVEG